jgi:hypothetical protein
MIVLKSAGMCFTISLVPDSGFIQFSLIMYVCSTVTSNAIVSSLFPETVKKQLMETQAKQQPPDETLSKRRLKAFLMTDRRMMIHWILGEAGQILLLSKMQSRLQNCSQRLP